MTSTQGFLETVDQPEPPADVGAALQVLWWARKGDWDKAHYCVQQHEGDPVCDLVHAHLHRQEGDLENAGHWYRSAGRPVPAMSLQDEWTTIVTELVSAR
jgi:hypothetical protein